MTQEKEIMLTEQERRLIQLLRSLGYGEADLLVQNGQPVEIKEMRRSTLLDH